MLYVWFYNKLIIEVLTQKYFNHEIVENGISTSGLFQADTIRLFQDDVSKFVDDKDLDNFFLSPTLEDQAIAFQRISSGLENAILWVWHQCIQDSLNSWKWLVSSFFAIPLPLKG